jgi:hypothetical protein
VERGGKETAAAVHQEVARGLDTLLPRIFAERRKAGELDIEAVELALRTALHSTGTAGLTELLRQPGRLCCKNCSGREQNQLGIYFTQVARFSHYRLWSDRQTPRHI